VTLDIAARPHSLTPERNQVDIVALLAVLEEAISLLEKVVSTIEVIAAAGM
jgi:hypothetical protein